MLYRGVNEIYDKENNGLLQPKGNIVAVVATLDGSWELDGKIILEHCQTNTARAHQIKSGLYGGCGISTSRSVDVAIRFATHNNTQDGFIYVIDETALSTNNVIAYELPDPKHQDQFEVTLIEQNGRHLPPEIILEKYAVYANGDRK